MERYGSTSRYMAAAQWDVRTERSASDITSTSRSSSHLSGKLHLNWSGLRIGMIWRDMLGRIWSDSQSCHGSTSPPFHMPETLARKTPHQELPSEKSLKLVDDAPCR